MMRRQRRKQPTKSGLESPKLETNENIERRQMRYYAGFSINYRREWTFLDTNAIINGPYLFIAGGIVFCFVLLQSFVFLRRAWKRGKEIGLSTEKMKNAVSQSAVFSHCSFHPHRFGTDRSGTNHGHPIQLDPPVGHRLHVL